MKINSKLPHVGTTIFSVMSALANENKAINLSQGFPDFAASEYLLERLNYHATAGRNQYAPMNGVPELREAIADLIGDCYGRKVDAETEITLASGATEALFVAVQAIIRPGDDVILLDPAYDSYEPAITLAGGSCTRLSLVPPRYQPDWQQIEDSIKPNTRLIMVNSPHNPTATAFTDSDWRELERIADKHNLLVISDEVYEHIVFERERNSAHRYPGLAERTFVVSSFGKTFHVTGWKLGYCVAPPALSEEFRKVHQFVTFTSFTPAQYAVADMLTEKRDEVHALGAFYQRKRDCFIHAMRGSRFELLPSAGTYFVLADYSALSDLNDVDYCHQLTREHGVAAIPLSVFYETPPESRIVRFCFAKREQTLIDAAARLKTL
ncbi:methionine aminotransferase [Litorivivens lipolytica]|uniref:Methionine aminotransferase n=1 Tax=Litorivivens lipolytica TaxID=1524264 RepID=A0A7W4W6S4_9GAMM|nr:methionine aminotransferase [Litorivivens lipolytica]MBB3048501.1 methionine aminotransferase [Litorivivens lipolytica]